MKKLWNRIASLKLNTKFTALTIAVFIIPIAFLAGMLYYNMEKNVVEENITYLGYIMDRNETSVKTNMDAINMSSQFTLSDEQMKDYLRTTAKGEKYTTEQMMQFNENDIAAIERLVNNNPLLYSVRVYATNDNVQELMPVLFQSARMQRMQWAQEENIYGWHYGYADTLFSALESMNNQHIMSLVSPINDYDYGTIGVVEVAMDMSTMFPSLYEQVENQWSGFITNDGTIYSAEGGMRLEDNLIDRLKTVADEQVAKGEYKTTTYYKKIDRNRYVVSYIPFKELGGTLVSVRDITSDVQEIYNSRTIFILVALGIIALLTVVVNLIVNHMLKQFYVILKTMQQVQDGDLTARIENHSKDEMGVLGTSLNTMMDRIQVLIKDNINREVLVKNTEIRALQNQINAHFIYNSLESIKMMAEIDEEYAISDAITALGKLLRYGMRWVSTNVRVRDELEYIRNYIALINLRFDYEIILSENIEENLLNQEIPKMSLQPIVENAIIHGIEEVAEDTTIYIKAYASNGESFIEITDSGSGMTEEQVLRLKKKIAGEIEAAGGSGNGIGLKNVQDRINIAFGDGYGLDIVSQIDCYTKIIVHLPYVVSDPGLK